MMDTFFTFGKQGFFHILDFNGIDHILFLLALCAVYETQDWKKILYIISSFTIAHSITLALSVLDVIHVETAIIEFLIACTIAFTCIENLFLPKLNPYRVWISGLFGLIHGMGFSFLLKSLFVGMQLNLFTTLVPFNLGLELGQIVIISTILLVKIGCLQGRLLSTKHVNYLISIPVLLQALWWMWERRPC